MSKVICSNCKHEMQLNLKHSVWSVRLTPAGEKFWYDYHGSMFFALPEDGRTPRMDFQEFLEIFGPAFRDGLYKKLFYPNSFKISIHAKAVVEKHQETAV